MAWLFMICGLAVTLLSLDVGLAVPWLIAAIGLVILAVALLIHTIPNYHDASSREA